MTTWTTDRPHAAGGVLAEQCGCQKRGKTEPHEKIEPEQQNCGDCSGGYCGDKYEPCGCDCHDEPVRKPEPRPNVPPRMMA